MCASLPRLLPPLQPQKMRLGLGYDQFHSLFQKLLEDYDMSADQKNHYSHPHVCERPKLSMTSTHLCETSGSSPSTWLSEENHADIDDMFEITAFPNEVFLSDMSGKSKQDNYSTSLHVRSAKVTEKRSNTVYMCESPSCTSTTKIQMARDHAPVLLHNSEQLPKEEVFMTMFPEYPEREHMCVSKS